VTASAEPTTLPFLLSVDEFAKREGLSRYRAWREVSRGSIRTFRIEGRRFVPSSELTDWPARKLAEQENGVA
jgi:hypothetical protein